MAIYPATFPGDAHAMYLTVMKKLPLAFSILFGLQFITAVACAPHSCEWGNAVYFFSGLAILMIAFVMPLLQKQWPLYKRVLLGLLFVLLAAVTWCVWFMVLDFKIVCRLF